MAHIVCMTHGLTGLLYSSFELMRRLQVAGYHVTCASTADVGEVVSAQGFDFVQLPGNEISKFLKEDRKASQWKRLRSLPRRRQLALQAMGADRFPALLQELEPDLLLIDLEMHVQIIAAIPRGIPIALLNPWMSIWKHPGLPPLHKAIVPGIGWRGSRIGVDLVWLRFRVDKLRRAWRQMRDRVGLDLISLMRQHARGCGVAFLREVELHQWQIPFSYRALPVLCLRGRALEFPHEPRPNVHYLGPMIHRQRVELQAHPDVDAALSGLFSRRRLERGDQRLIYCGFSSFVATHEDILERLIEAFEKRPRWDLILGLGKKLELEQLGPLPANIHAFTWVPQLRVLEHADAAIVHGGINTVDECLQSGVPMLVYCCGLNDTPGNMARVVYHGLGVAGDPKSDSPETILEHLEQVLADTDIKANIQRMQDRIEHYASERYAERIIAELLQNP